MTNLYRSFLFVPANHERKIAKAQSSGADAIILDLEDSVMSADKPAARDLCSHILNARPLDTDMRTSTASPAIWVRINPLGTAEFEDDLNAIMAAQPDGIMFPKPDGPVDVQTLSDKITALEIQHDLPQGGIKILPIATETARAVGSLSLYPRTFLPRLWGLTWGAEDLASDLGATDNRDEDGAFFFVHQMSRAHTLLAAKASGVYAVESIYADFRDTIGLEKFAKRAFVEGFNAMMAIHPNQIETINRCFMPSPDQTEHARAVVQAFAKNPGAGAISVNGKMTDIPHLKQAQNTLALAEKFGI